MWHPIVPDEDPLDGFVEDDAGRNLRPLVRSVRVSEGEMLLDPQRLDLALDRAEDRVADLALSAAGKGDPDRENVLFI